MVVDDMVERKRRWERVLGFVGVLLRRDGVHKVGDVLGLYRNKWGDLILENIGL